MSKKKKKNKLTENKLNLIHLEEYQKDIGHLLGEGQKHYHPKIGRKVSQIRKKMKQVA